jgi:hypothetical protein
MGQHRCTRSDGMITRGPGLLLLLLHLWRVRIVTRIADAQR